jgi:hypothetical protein
MTMSSIPFGIPNHLQCDDLIKSGTTSIQPYSLQDAMTVAEKQQAFISGSPMSPFPHSPGAQSIVTAPNMVPDAMDLPWYLHYLQDISRVSIACLHFVIKEFFAV